MKRVVVLLMLAAPVVPSGQTPAKPTPQAAIVACDEAVESAKGKADAERVAASLRCVALYEAAFAPGAIEIADKLNVAGTLLYNTRDFAGAVNVLAKEVLIREQAKSVDQSDLIEALWLLGLAKRNTEDFAGAETANRRAVTLAEQVPDAPHLKYLNSLLRVLDRLGKNADAEAVIARGTRLIDTHKNDPAPYQAVYQGQFLVAVVSFYNNAGQPGRSLEPARASLALRERSSKAPETDSGVAVGAYSLGAIYQELGDFANAEPLYERALAIYARVAAPPALDMSRIKVNLAMIRLLQRRYAEAEPLYADALRLSESINGPTHAEVAGILERQAVFYQVVNRPDAALRAMRRSSEIHEEKLRTNLVRESDAAARSFMTTVQENTEIGLSLRGSLLHESPEASTWAATLTLQRKGRVLDATVALKDRAAALASVDVAAVQKLLAPDTVLVEYVRYRPFDPTAIGQLNRFGAARYAVFTLRSTGVPRWIELGESARIDAQVQAFRRALRSPATPVTSAARALATSILDPITGDLAGAARVVVSPDSELSVIPFGALMDATDSYLVERFEVSYLASGRDLIRLADHRPSRESALVVASPDFNSGGPAQTGPFRPLRGTAEEAAALKTLIPDVRVMTGTAATESVLKATRGPRLLHIATHGFFDQTLVPASGAAANSRGVPSRAAPNAGGDPFSMLQSGLALAGANQRRPGGGEDGLLTAAEVAGLDLHGTALVVLSACDTGLGNIANGDGVYGLRRALDIAGAESQVMSFWQVNDQATRQLMVAFYKRLMAGEGRAASLRAVQLQLRQSKLYAHPYYWAAFVVAGSPGPLRER